MSALLKAKDLVSGYGRSQVLFGMHLHIETGQFVALLGRNGMGKTTTITGLMGMHPIWQGTIELNGTPIAHMPSHRVARRGLGLVPEGRRVFPNLTVRENLVATSANRRKHSSPWNLSRIYQLFPRLQERAGNFGNQLSGGEQQMLAISRALMTNPQLLILDEATEGLSPLIRQEIWNALKTLRQEGMAILVVDKNLAHLLALSDYNFVIEKGRVVWEGVSDDLKTADDVWQQYLGA